MGKYGLQNKYLSKKSFIHRRISGTDVLISVGDNIADFNGYIQINGSALVLWEMLSEACTVEQLENALIRKYGISREQAENDVQEFLGDLDEHDMLEIQ